MGIPSYFSFLVKNYTRILKNIKHFDNKIIHNLLLDSNSIAVLFPNKEAFSI